MEEIVCYVAGVEVRLKDGCGREFIRRMAAFALERGFDARFVIPLRLFPQKYHFPGMPEGQLVELSMKVPHSNRDVVCIACNYRQRHDVPSAMKCSTLACPGCGETGPVVFLPEL
jgi:hypothetical protein